MSRYQHSDPAALAIAKAALVAHGYTVNELCSGETMYGAVALSVEQTDTNFDGRLTWEDAHAKVTVRRIEPRERPCRWHYVVDVNEYGRYGR